MWVNHMYMYMYMWPCSVGGTSTLSYMVHVHVHACHWYMYMHVAVVIISLSQLEPPLSRICKLSSIGSQSGPGDNACPFGINYIINHAH